MATPRPPGIDLEQVGSPGSLMNLDEMADPQDSDSQNEKKQYATIKAEIKSHKSGQKSIVFKEGQHYINRMPEQSIEMVKHAMLEVHKADGRGVDTKKVMEFINSTIDFLRNGNPTVKDMRSGNPRAVQLLFHMEEMIKGSTKIKKTWAPENKPAGWPKDVPFEDPNNGSQTKKERAASDCKNDKLRKDGLTRMYVYLRGEFLSREDEILQRKEEYMNNLPKALRPTGTIEPRRERLVLLYHRTKGVLLEAVSETSIATNLSDLVDALFERASEGERMRILFAEFCTAIQTCIDVALVKDNFDCSITTDKLSSLYDQYKVVTRNNSIQQVSTDIPERYTGQDGFQVGPQGIPVIPSPGGNHWNHMSDQLAPSVPQLQQSQQPMMYQPQQQTVRQQPQALQQFPQQPQSVATVSKQETGLLQQDLKMLRMGEPSTTMNSMYNTSTYQQVAPMVELDIEYSEYTRDVLPNDNLGKRKLENEDEEIVNSSGKTYTPLEPQMPATIFTTGQFQISDFQTLLADLEANNGVKVLAPVPPAEQLQLNSQLFAQETTAGSEGNGVNYWYTPTEMEVDQ